MTKVIYLDQPVTPAILVAPWREWWAYVEKMRKRGVSLEFLLLNGELAFDDVGVHLLIGPVGVANAK